MLKDESIFAGWTMITVVMAASCAASLWAACSVSSTHLKGTQPEEI